MSVRFNLTLRSGEILELIDRCKTRATASPWWHILFCNKRPCDERSAHFVDGFDGTVGQRPTTSVRLEGEAAAIGK